MMWRHQTLITLILAVLLIGAVGVLRPAPQMDSPDAYWARKMLWGPDFDVVICGDSRMNRGVAPEVMGRTLKGLRIVNFAFQSNALTRDYLAAAAAKLNPQSARRIIVIGLDPIALTPASAKENKYLEMTRKNPLELQQQAKLDAALKFFDPLVGADVDKPVQTRTGNKTKTYHADGWVAVRELPMQPERTLPFYRDFYRGNAVSPELLEDLFDMVKEWRGRGIEVYGLRPPVPEAMVKLENELSGYDEAAIAAKFRAAGGVWLDFDNTKYPSYDGSHLDANAARKFSDHLATKIAKARQAG